MEIKNILDQIKAFDQDKIDNQSKEKKAKVSQDSKTDKISVSKEAKLLSKALHLAKDIPEERTEKITSLKEQIANNTYQPDPKKIAEKIIKEELDLWS